LVIFFQLTHSQKELSFPTVKVNLETEEVSLELQEPLPLSSVTPKMEKRPESDSHQAPEKPSLVTAEPWLEFAPVDKEPINHSLRPLPLGTRLEERETTGQELEVSQ
jgi:hypothetical protein